MRPFHIDYNKICEWRLYEGKETDTGGNGTFP